jgi:hypothetical protein
MNKMKTLSIKLLDLEKQVVRAIDLTEVDRVSVVQEGVIPPSDKRVLPGNLDQNREKIIGEYLGILARREYKGSISISFYSD